MARNPHRPGDRVEATVEKIVAKGYGLARVRGVVFLIPLSAPGDRLEVEVTEAKRSMCFAEPRRILAPGSDRIPPDCPHSGDCGGCAFRHLTYAAELRAKSSILAEALHGIPLAAEPPLPSPVDRCRNKLLMTLARTGDGLAAGFYARGSHRLVRIRHCLLQTEAVNDLRDAFLALAPRHLPDRALDALTHLLIRSSRTGALLLCAVARRPVDLAPLAEALHRAVPALATMLLFKNGADGNVPFERRAANPYAADPLEIASGDGAITETVGGVPFHLGPESFFQVNAHQLEPMVETVRAFAASPEVAAAQSGTLLDLYCGAGFFGLTLRERFARVFFADTSLPAIASLRERAKSDPGLVPLLGCAGDAAASLERDGIRPDCAVVDPPRAGLAPDLAATLARLAPPRIVMVSCHAATLARDLALLAGHGYRPARCRPIDNFPRTPHLECVVALERERA